MTRKITIGATKVEVSKNEAKEAERIVLFPKDHRQHVFEVWLFASPTPEARARRIAVGKALGLKVAE